MAVTSHGNAHKRLMPTTKTTTTAKKGVYAFFFNQKGLMAGLGLQGTKITRIYPAN